MATNVSLQQLLGRPAVIGAFSRQAATGTALSAFYGLTPSSTGTQRAPTRHLTYDIFNNTRQMSSVRAPGIGPARVRPQRVGSNTIQCMRIYESIPIEYEKLGNIRAIGGDYSTVDTMGAAYILRQQGYLAQRMKNASEFMVSRMFRGGWGLEFNSDEDHRLTETGAGDVDIDMKIPSGNKGTIGSRLGGAWQTSTTDVASELLALSKYSESLSGYPITNIWINSTTYGYLLQNDELQATGGSAYRVFDTFTRKPMETTDGSRPQLFSVQFRAIPQYTFHVYDAVSVTHQDPATEQSSNSLFIPDNKAIFTPDPVIGTWYGMGVGAEPIRKSLGGNVELSSGLDAWTWPMDDPPGVELRSLVNMVPFLTTPNAVFYGTVSS